MTTPSVIAVGNFDGVHRGHQALFAEARRIADDVHQRTGQLPQVTAVSFRAHPLSVLKPGEQPPMILHPEQREAALRNAGADRVDWLDPTVDLLKLQPTEFLKQMVERYQPIAMVEGVNFRFGRGRAGGHENLPAMGRELGFDVSIVQLDQITLRDKLMTDVSSSLVRWLIGRGRMVDVSLCLGRPYVLRGNVVEGEKRGRTIGYPTINLNCGLQMLPCDGVYGGRVELNGQTHAAAVSIGHKPTFGQRMLTCEAHLLDFDGDLYGQTVDLTMLRWLRDQIPFANVDALKQQLHHDTQQVRHLHETGMLDAAALVAVGE